MSDLSIGSIHSSSSHGSGASAAGAAGASVAGAAGGGTGGSVTIGTSASSVAGSAASHGSHGTTGGDSASGASGASVPVVRRRSLSAKIVKLVVNKYSSLYGRKESTRAYAEKAKKEKVTYDYSVFPKPIQPKAHWTPGQVTVNRGLCKKYAKALMQLAGPGGKHIPKCDGTKESQDLWKAVALLHCMAHGEHDFPEWMVTRGKLENVPRVHLCHYFTLGPIFTSLPELTNYVSIVESDLGKPIDTVNRPFLEAAGIEVPARPRFFSQEGLTAGWRRILESIRIFDATYPEHWNADDASSVATNSALEDQDFDAEEEPAEEEPAAEEPAALEGDAAQEGVSFSDEGPQASGDGIGGDGTDNGHTDNPSVAPAIPVWPLVWPRMAVMCCRTMMRSPLLGRMMYHVRSLLLGCRAFPCLLLSMGMQRMLASAWAVRLV